MGSEKTQFKPGNDDGQKFSKDYQPTPEAKSEGWKAKRMIEKLAEQLVTGDAFDQIKEEAKEIGIDFDSIDLETAMWIKQAFKAYKNADTTAYNAAMDRLRGKAIQETKETGTLTINQQPIWKTTDAKKK